MEGELNVDIRTINVTPEIAKELLGYNKKNRAVRRGVVSAYARDMAADKWLLNGETIKFATNGELVDGQHRLLAVIESNRTVPMTVVTDVDPDAWGTIDAGAAKTASDMLAMKGVPDPALQGSVARFALLLENVNNNASGNKVTNTEVAEYLQDHPEVYLSTRRTDQARSLVRGVRPTILVYADMHMAAVSEKDAVEFWHAAANLVADFDGDPAVAVSRRFADLYIKRQRLTDLESLDVIFRAWNKRRRRLPLRTVKIVPVASVEDLPRLR